MTIRSHVPWPLRFVVALVAVAAAGAIGAWWASSGFASAQKQTDHAELESLREDNGALRAERDHLLLGTDTTESKRAMERSTLKEMADQIGKIETENAKLKEDIAFFEAATSDRSDKASTIGGIAIRRFQVTQDKTAHTARYRLLVTQDSKANRDFSGDLQLVVTITQGGKTANITFPDLSIAASARSVGPGGVMIDGDAAQFRVAFRSYKRMEGSLRLPAEASLRAVHAKILEHGAIRAQQTVTLG